MPPNLEKQHRKHRGTENSQRYRGKLIFSVHRGFGCTPRTAANRVRVTTRNTVSPHVGRGGAHKASLGRRERQSDGSAAAGHVNFGVHRGFGCTPRTAGNRVRVHPPQHRVPTRRPWRGAQSFPGTSGTAVRWKRGRGPCEFLGSSRIWLHAAHCRKSCESSPPATPCPHTSAVAGRTRLPWGRRERQTDGSAAGGHPHFFRNSIVFRSAPQPAIPASPDARSREPSLARPRRECADSLALRGFARSRIRCSWRLGPVRFPQASPPADDGDEHGRARMSTDEHEGSPQKISHGPLPHFLPRTHPRLRLHRASCRTTAEASAENHSAPLQPDRRRAIISLYLWLLSVPLYPPRFLGPA